MKVMVREEARYGDDLVLDDGEEMLPGSRESVDAGQEDEPRRSGGREAAGDREDREREADVETAPRRSGGRKAVVDRRKTLCVWTPWFRTELEAREQPEWVELPRAVYRAGSQKRELVEVSPGAAEAGLAVGMSFKEAQMRCPPAVFIPDDEAKYRAAFARVLDVMDQFSPVVEAVGPGLAFMDATGLEPLYGPDADLVRRVRAAVQEATSYVGRVGLAEGGFAAEIAARTAGDDGVAVAMGADAEYLAGLPLEMLPLGEKALKQLRLLGIRDLGEFAELPANTVRAKYGEEGGGAQRLAAGRDDRRLEPRERPLVLEEEVEFEWEEHNLDRITFALQALADRLARRLEARGLMARRMRAEIGHSDGTIRAFELNLPEPSARARTFCDVVRWWLDAAETTAVRPLPGSIDEVVETDPGISAIRIEVSELAPFEGKVPNLFANRAERLAKANQAIGRLRVALGEEAVYRGELRGDERAPERAFGRVDAYVTDGKKKASAERRSGKEKVPVAPVERYAAESGGSLRLLDPPRAATFMEDERGGERVRFDGRVERVIGRYGPHRLRSGWWETPLARDYYRVLLEGGGGLLMYREGEGWFVQGVVD
jgi:protein ImuB